VKTLLAIHSWPGANEIVARHWPYFLKQGADEIWGIGTNDNGCKWPEGIQWQNVGRNSYIDGSHLPQRMLDTLTQMLSLDLWNTLILTEYDTVFFNRIPVENLKHCLAGHYAGGPTWGSKANCFYHNPWVFDRNIVMDFVVEGHDAIKEGICPDRHRGQPPAAECSPDVFFAYIAQRLGYTVQDDLWREYSRNDLKDPERLEGARKAYQDGVDIIHGIKTQDELNYITQP